ncbi:MAG: peptidoglycan DD-metalloendopeptidase family protein [Clostridiales bacterium]|nr:peptidoglycan DD-metalloendopeptidase family protein [Clostridiales bacterium]
MRHSHRPAKRILAGVLALSIFTATQTVSPISAQGDDLIAQQEQLDQQKKDLDQKEKELSKLRSDLEKRLLEIQEDKDRQVEYRDTLKQQINVLEQQIRNTEDQIDQLDREIKEKSRLIENHQQEIEADYELLKKRLRAIYMSGEASGLDILLGATDVNDFLDKSMILQRISQRDTQLIEKLKSSVERIQGEKDDVEQNREKVMQANKRLQSQKEELNSLQKECNAIIRSLQGQQDETQQQRLDAIREQEAFDEELARWHREYVANQKAQQNVSSSQPTSSVPSSSSSSSISPSEPSSSSPSSQPESTSPPEPDPPSVSPPAPPPDPGPAQSKYLWPLPGFTTITDYFGDRPIYGYHRGLDIAGGNVFRAKIVAAEDGVVIRANKTDSWGSGWGYHVMIDHGDGYATQYAHCDEVLVNVGDHVKRGDTIALVGNTGNSYGAHLHFEVWNNGTRIDPLPFLRG